MEERKTPTEFRDFLIEYTKKGLEKGEPDCLEQLPALLKAITELTALFRDA